MTERKKKKQEPCTGDGNKSDKLVRAEVEEPRVQRKTSEQLVRFYLVREISLLQIQFFHFDDAEESKTEANELRL